MYSSCSCHGVTQYDQSPNGPNTPQELNTSGGSDTRAAFHLEKVSSLIEMCSFTWSKIPGTGDSPAPATFQLYVSFLCFFISGIGVFLKGSPGWQEAETQDKTKQTRSRKRKVVSMSCTVPLENNPQAHSCCVSLAIEQALGK